MNVANCFQHHIRTGDMIGSILQCALYTAEAGREVVSEEKLITKSFLEFLSEAEDKNKLLDCDGLPMVTSCGYVGMTPNYSGHHSGFSFGRMSNIINSYLLTKGIDRGSFQGNYFEFVDNCRRTGANILSEPDKRTEFGEEAKVYDDFCDFLRGPE